MQIEKRCRLTQVENPAHLRASHCKPWRDSNNDERLHGENGLLLTPSIDHLFDRGFISLKHLDASSSRQLLTGLRWPEWVWKLGYRSTSANLRKVSSTILNYHRSSVLLRSAL